MTRRGVKKLIKQLFSKINIQPENIDVFAMNNKLDHEVKVMLLDFYFYAQVIVAHGKEVNNYRIDKFLTLKRLKG